LYVDELNDDDDDETDVNTVYDNPIHTSKIPTSLRCSVEQI